jgi:thioredoxin 1
MLEPVLEELASEFEGSVDFFNADVDANMELAVKYSISSIPAIYVFKDGENVGQAIGFRPKEELKSFVEAYL